MIHKLKTNIKNSKEKNWEIGDYILDANNNLFLRIAKTNNFVKDFYLLTNESKQFENSQTINWFENSAEIKLSELPNNGLLIKEDGLFNYDTDVSFNKIILFNPLIINNKFNSSRTITLKQNNKFTLIIPERMYDIINETDSEQLINIDLIISIDDKKIITRMNTNCLLLEKEYNTFLGLSEYIELNNNKEIKIELNVNSNEEFHGKIYIHSIYGILVNQ